MLDFLIFAVTFAVVLIVAVIYLYPGGSKSTTIPGLDPSDPKDGNLIDIAKAGSLHEFLLDLHNNHGQIASFWMGQKLVVSIASTDLFEAHSKVFDRPGELFGLYNEILGSDSLLFANGAEGRRRRNAYDKCFTPAAVKQHIETFQADAEELTSKWQSLPAGEHVPVSQYMLAVTLKCLAQSILGPMFDDAEKVYGLRKNFDLCWSELENQLKDSPSTPDPLLKKRFEEAKENIHKMLREAMESCKKEKIREREPIFRTAAAQSGLPESAIISDAMTNLVWGFHSVGMFLTWCLYFLATHQEVQDKVYEEIKEVLKDTKITDEGIRKLKYTRQVLEETLRCSQLVTWTARHQDFDSELGGHKVPSGTPVVHALGVVMECDNLWPEPNKFDPDRFSEANKEGRPNFAFEPFGFAGRRKCPAESLSYLQATVMVTLLLRKFKVTMVEGQVVLPEYGIVTRPQEEVWVTLEKRKQT